MDENVVDHDPARNTDSARDRGERLINNLASLCVLIALAPTHEHWSYTWSMAIILSYLASVNLRYYADSVYRRQPGYVAFGIICDCAMVAFLLTESPQPEQRSDPAGASDSPGSPRCVQYEDYTDIVIIGIIVRILLIVATFIVGVEFFLQLGGFCNTVHAIYLGKRGTGERSFDRRRAPPQAQADADSIPLVDVSTHA